MYNLYRFLVVEDKEGEFKGLFYYDKFEGKFHPLQMNIEILISPMRYLFQPLYHFPWLFLESVKGFRHFFYRSFQLPVPTEREIFRGSGLKVEKENQIRSTGKGKLFWNHHLPKIFVFYIFPGLEIEILFGQREYLVSVPDLKSIRVNLKQRALELVTYREKLTKNVERVHQREEERETVMNRFYEDGHRLLQFRLNSQERLMEALSSWDKESTWSPQLHQALEELGFEDPKDLLLLEDRSNIEFVIFNDKQHIRVLNQIGEEIHSMRQKGETKIYREEGKWVVETEGQQVAFYYEEGELVVRRDFKSKSVTNRVSGLTRSRREGGRLLGYHKPLTVHENSSGKIVLYDYGQSTEVFGLNEEGSVRFNMELPRWEELNLQFDEDSKTLRIEVERNSYDELEALKEDPKFNSLREDVSENGSHEIKEITEEGLFRHQMSHGGVLLEILKRIASRMSRPSSVSGLSIARSVADEQKLGLRDTVESFLDRGTDPSKITFYGNYIDNSQHLQSDITSLWGDVLFATLQAGNRGYIFNAKGEELGRVENWDPKKTKLIRDVNGKVWLRIRSSQGENFIEAKMDSSEIEVRGNTGVFTRKKRTKDPFGFFNRPEIRQINPNAPPLHLLGSARIVNISL